jgi:hypothetical protein
MALGEETREILAELPGPLRAGLADYLATVEDASSSIFHDAGLELTPAQRERFIFLVGVRRVWLIADSQYQVLRRAQADLQRFGVDEMVVGSVSYGRHTAEYAAVVELRSNLRKMLLDTGLEPVLHAGELKDLAILAVGQVQ